MSYADTTTLVLPDVHVPEHDPLALACAMLIGEHVLPHRTVQTGDMIEARAFSSHPRKTMPENERSLFRETELDPAAAFIRQAQNHWTDEWQYVFGNHEHRVERFCANSSLGFDVWDALSPKAWFEGFCGVTPYQSEPAEAHYKIADDLWCVHGWSTGKYSEQKHLDVCTDMSIIHGHTHVFGTARQVMPSRQGLIDMLSMSPGCLRTLSPAWLGAKPQPWSHGVCLIYQGAHSWSPHMIPIFKGRAVLEGGVVIQATQYDVDRMHDMMGLYDYFNKEKAAA